MKAFFRENPVMLLLTCLVLSSVLLAMPPLPHVATKVVAAICAAFMVWTVFFLRSVAKEVDDRERQDDESEES